MGSYAGKYESTHDYKLGKHTIFNFLKKIR